MPTQLQARVKSIRVTVQIDIFYTQRYQKISKVPQPMYRFDLNITTIIAKSTLPPASSRTLSLDTCLSSIYHLIVFRCNALSCRLLANRHIVNLRLPEVRQSN